jgi:hypothetical protein
MERFTDEHFDELRNQVLAQGVILSVLCWNLERKGQIDGATFQATLETAAKTADEIDRKFSRNIREFASTYPSALTADRQKSIFPFKVIPGGKPSASDEEPMSD